MNSKHFYVVFVRAGTSVTVTNPYDVCMAELALCSNIESVL